MAPDLGETDPGRGWLSATRSISATWSSGWWSWPTTGSRWSSSAARSPSGVASSTSSPPPPHHPVRVEFFGDEIIDMRTFAVTDQRSIEPVVELVAPPCREILLTDDVRARAPNCRWPRPATRR